MEVSLDSYFQQQLNSIFKENVLTFPLHSIFRGAIGLSKEAQIAAVTARKAACGSGACGCFEASSALQSLSGWRVESSTKIALAALAGAFVCVGVAYYLRRQSV